jgi:diguanylate cyclase (GGDEF)-like protein
VRLIGALKNIFRFTIPVKVVLLTGVAYMVVWATGIGLAYLGVDFTREFFGVEFAHIYLAFEVLSISVAAALGTHLFLDRPLSELTGAMAKAESGDFLIRAPHLSEDELGDLARNFNRMLTRITDLAANNIQTDQDLKVAQEQLLLRNSLEEKNDIIQRTNGALEKLVRDLSLIYEIGQEVNSIIDLDNLYSKITETLHKHLKIQEFAILIFDDKRDELYVKAAYGFEDKEAILSTSFRKGEGITGLVAETGRKIYIKDTSREERFLHYKGERPARPSSFLSIPLVYKDDVMGVINFARVGRSSFSSQDVKKLSLVSGQIALAIANAQLYTRTRELSVRDELTGINNRRYFQQMLQMEWKRAVRFHRTISLIMLDVDHFKMYNDTFGHLQGDKVLKGIGSLLKNNLREVDTVARFGGEEFIMLLPDTDKVGAIVVAEKVRLLVEQRDFLADDRSKTRMVTVSVGLSTYPDDVGDMDDLIDHADIALYRAKENGRNRIECFAPPTDGDDENVEEATEVVSLDEVSGADDAAPKRSKILQ